MGGGRRRRQPHRHVPGEADRCGRGRQGQVDAALGNGAFRLINRHSGKALDNANSGADNTQVIQWTPNGGAPQQWNMTKVG
nr:RICIN domain-containing protein [Streptomyces canus]